MIEQMRFRKKTVFTKSIIIIFSFLMMVFFSVCDKSSSKEESIANLSEENLSLSSQKDSSESADIKDEALTTIEREETPAIVLESVVSEQIRRPRQGESPRYPEDSIIGELGQGEAPVESYRFVQELLQELLPKESRQEFVSNLPIDNTEGIINILQEIDPENVRIGGGREEADGSISFLLRFIGTNSWSGGEIYVSRSENTWIVEDLILDEPGEQNKTNGQYRFNFPPYERFF
jgi:hypothetical protein